MAPEPGACGLGGEGGVCRHWEWGWSFSHRLRGVFMVITTKQTNWRLEFDLLLWETVQRLSMSQLLQCRQEIWGPWNYHHQFLTQPSPCLWNLLSSGQMTAGERKAFTTSFDLWAQWCTWPALFSLDIPPTHLQTENVEEMVKSSILLILTCCKREGELLCLVTVS